ncbi:hypothetical protein K3725_15200 [Leisingera sp. S132]|uniref:hypothetical protein n=1 Tax=Leisingera sp. S132 TaxID=2867016 RepID=UPI0021A8C4AB|nr:hypothetical protein [Leisingera sp. S132]UWQ78642.1 hypothetical protein K3725_15200 [Leisingera sp. S132]
MQTDLALVLGLVIGGFTVPAVLAGLSERRPPRASLLPILAAIALVTYAVMMNPGGYSVEEIPDVFSRVAAQLF